MTRAALLALSLALIFVGCVPSQQDTSSSEDPMAALLSDVESSRYGVKYWVHQRNADSKTWNEAVEVCAASKAAANPTCQIVLRVRFYTQPTEAPTNPRTAPGFDKF